MIERSISIIRELSIDSGKENIIRRGSNEMRRESTDHERS